MIDPQRLDKPTTHRPEPTAIALSGVTWERYKAIDTAFGETKHIKLSYLAGVMEIISPIGDQHEYIKTTLGYLLEAYLREKGIRFYGRGGFTLEALGYSSGTPDESYCIGTNKAIPDIVI